MNVPLLRERNTRHDDEVATGHRIAFLELIMSEACNLRCQYCIHFNNLETSNRLDSPHKFMTFDTARRAVDAYVAILRRTHKRTAEINLGGEPLLAWPVMKQVLEYCVSTHGSELDFRFSINTNATLMTTEIATTLRQYDVSVAVSLDGLEQGNDKVRMTKTRRGTFLRIVNGIDALGHGGGGLDGFAVTITERNFVDLDERLIDWAVGRNMSEVRIDIDVCVRHAIVISHSAAS